MVDQAIGAIRQYVDRQIKSVAAFRATVTAVNGSLIQIRREGASTAGTESYASCTRFLLAVGDVVLCIPLGGKPVVIDVIRRSAAASPSIAAGAAAGTGTASLVGSDRVGRITLTGGSGRTTGTLFTVTFAVERPSTNYVVIMTPVEADALSSIASVRAFFSSTTAWIANVPSTPINGNEHIWQYMVEQFDN